MNTNTSGQRQTTSDAYDGSGSLGLDSNQFSNSQQDQNSTNTEVDPNIRHPGQQHYRGSVPNLGNTVGGDYESGQSAQSGYAGVRSGNELGRDNQSSTGTGLRGTGYDNASTRGQNSGVLAQSAGLAGTRSKDPSSYDTSSGQDYTGASSNSAAGLATADRLRSGPGAGSDNYSTEEERLRHRQTGTVGSDAYDSSKGVGTGLHATGGYTKSGIGREGEGLGATQISGSNVDANTDRFSNDQFQNLSSTGDNTGSRHSGAALAGAGVATAGAGYAGSRYIDDQSNTDDYSSRNLGGQSGAGFGSGGRSTGGMSGGQYDNAPSSLTDISNPEDARRGMENLSMKHTDNEGFTDLTGGQGRSSSGDALFTGRVKGVDERVRGTGNGGDVVVETNAERSQRDSQGRELDSYGKPYVL